MIVTTLSPELFRGVADLEQTARGVRPHRLPEWARQQYPDPNLLAMESQPSGVRLAFRTTAGRVELESHPSRVAYEGANRPRGRIDVFVDGELTLRDTLTGGDATVINMLTGTMTPQAGGSHTTVLDAAPGDKLVEMWLPYNESLELVELRSNAPLTPVAETRPVWLHHGSSISHGSNAAAPSEIWPAVAAQRGGVALHNLGFGGNAQVDQFTARVIRDAPADVISVKLGINVTNGDTMRLRAFVPVVHGFLDTIREGHPTTPIVLVSPIFCGIQEHTPGPVAIVPESFGTDQVTFVSTGDPADVAMGKLTLSIIRRELASLVERRAADENLHYLDGTELYGPTDAVEHPLPDALHPDTETHRIIGERFADYAFAASGPFGVAQIAK